MYRRAAIVALFLQAGLLAVPQEHPPDAASEPVILKSTSRAVQLDVFVNDPSGRPVHGLQKSDFAVTDNGHPRDIRIFAGEIDANQTVPSSATTVLPPGVYSNRLGMRGSRIVTAIVIDAVPRPDGLQKNAGVFAAANRTGVLVLFGTLAGHNRDQSDGTRPGHSDLRRLSRPAYRAGLHFRSRPPLRKPEGIPTSAGTEEEPRTIEELVPPMLQALRDVVGGCPEPPAARVSSGFLRHMARN